MQQELLIQSMNLFDTPDKWDSFLELSNHRDNIRDKFFSKIKAPLMKYFNDNPVEGWVCESWGSPNYDMRWYLTDFGKNSLAIGIGWSFDFVLTLEDFEKFDSDRMNILMKQPEYAKILAAFGRIDYQFTEARRKVIESGNYSFGCAYDNNFEGFKYQLAWYAGNRTNDFVQQIINKVEKFRRNEEVTRQLYQLNHNAKR